jgi:hypothetical protein
MAAPTTALEEAPNWAVERATSLPEFWTLVAEHSGLVGAWRLTGVCRASREGARDWLRTLRRLVVAAAGSTGGKGTRARCGGWIWGSFSGSACLTSDAIAASTRPARCGGRRRAGWGKQ